MGAIIVEPGVNFSIQLTPAPGRLNLVYCEYVNSIPLWKSISLVLSSVASEIRIPVFASVEIKALFLGLSSASMRLSTSPFEFLIGVTSGITYLTLPFLFFSYFCSGSPLHKRLGLQTSFLSSLLLAIFAPILGQGFAKAGPKCPLVFYPPAAPLSVQTQG